MDEIKSIQDVFNIDLSKYGLRDEEVEEIVGEREGVDIVPVYAGSNDVVGAVFLDVGYGHGNFLPPQGAHYCEAEPQITQVVIQFRIEIQA